MSEQTQTELDAPLHDADWDRLDAILASLGDRAEVDLEGLDGLIAAFACGPRSLMPSQVLPLAFKYFGCVQRHGGSGNVPVSAVIDFLANKNYIIVLQLHDFLPISWQLCQ